MKNVTVKSFNFNSNQFNRFANLCKSFGLIVQYDATYTYANLVETAHPFLRIISKNKVVAIANLLD